ncbi:hypothetical protein ACHAWF_010895 [Thalassiosira exigua]
MKQRSASAAVALIFASRCLGAAGGVAGARREARDSRGGSEAARRRDRRAASDEGEVSRGLRGAAAGDDEGGRELQGGGGFVCLTPRQFGLCTATDQALAGEHECDDLGSPCPDGNPGEHCCLDACYRKYCTAKGVGGGSSEADAPPEGGWVLNVDGDESEALPLDLGGGDASSSSSNAALDMLDLLAWSGNAEENYGAVEEEHIMLNGVTDDVLIVDDTFPLLTDDAFPLMVDDMFQKSEETGEGAN